MLDVMQNTLNYIAWHIHTGFWARFLCSPGPFEHLTSTALLPTHCDLQQLPWLVQLWFSEAKSIMGQEMSL